MAKRVITDNPAQGLFNKESGQKTEVKETVQTNEMVVVPPKKETRSKKKLFMFEPSLYKEIEKKCRAMDISANEAANQLFRAWIDK